VMGIRMGKTTHCKVCKGLIYEDEQIYGYGLRCGCLKKYIQELKKGNVRQTRMFEVTK